VLRSERMWGRDRDDISILAQRVGGRTIVTASIDEDLQLVGPSPDALRPTIYNSTSYHFRIGVFLPRPGGGYHWVSGEGQYVTLDDQLQRIDPLPLRHHLRTRGSVGDFIDEPEHERALGWALFGLPALALVGLALAFFLRERHEDGTRGPWRLGFVMAALVAYAVTGGWALVRVLPLL